MSYGVVIKEENLEKEIEKYLEKVKPNILVITGHDSLSDNNKYKNSNNFIKAVKKAREYERNIDKLIIVAGACQSDYEELIKSGANFASSPKRINIHALDPAIIAARIALSNKNEPINLIEIIDNTKYKSQGFGGIITNGVMFQGYPR
jgi:spore coat assembly protein